MNKRPLFSSGDLRPFLDSNIASLRYAIETYNEDDLLSTPDQDLCNYFSESFLIEPISLLRDDIQVDHKEGTKHAQEFGRSFIVNILEVSYHIPITGDTRLFHLKPTTSTLAPPCGVISGNELIMTIDEHDLNSPKVKDTFERELSEVQRHIGWVNQDVEAHNTTVATKIPSLVSSRQSHILEKRKTVSALGFPLKTRSPQDTTYVIPQKRKTIKPSPPRTKSVFEPEPALALKEYNDILGIADNMALVMERNPQTFSTINEEALRDHFLLQLNGHYEGSATGETFNSSGKTDILIREANRNIFISECKFWRGPKGFTETIDQILGYTSWRDTKTAIFLFNRQKNLSKILQQIPELLSSHDGFKRHEKYDRECGFRATFRHNNDPLKELLLTVHVYEVPTEDDK